MTTHTLPSGIRVTLPDGLGLAPRPTASRQRRVPGRTPGVIAMPIAATDEADAVAAALAAQDLELAASLPLEPTPARGPGTRAGTAAGSAEVSVEMDLAADEGAVVLLEQDGLYAWHFEATAAPAPNGTREGRRRGPGAGRRQVTFRLPLGTTAPGTARRRGWLSDLVVGRARAFVFKYAGRFLLRRGAAFLERKVRTGLVLMQGDDPTAWAPAPDFAALTLPEDRPARILLFVHGTFSSTKGGFGALGATPWGRAFLAAARANYDAVVGFDHPTLSVDPLANATSLLRSLEARDWKQPAVIDAVSHSRGGITLRSLIEHLLPAAALPVRVERSVFIGAVNGGTALAEPGNWRTFINLYTNVAAGACRAVAMFPQTAFAAALTGELLQSVGALAKVLAEEAITEGAVPGLAAMQPEGAFIRELNQTQPGQPTAVHSRYYAITSEFQAKLALASLKELPRQLLLALADGAMDRLMAEANDLVVDTESMTKVDPGTGTFIKDTLAFGTNGTVYHTNYFLQPQVANALARWFELEVPASASPARMRGVIRGGGGAPANVPARVDTEVLVVQAEDTGPETRDRIHRRTPSYVVVERPYEDRLLHYAFLAEEVLEAIQRQPRDPLIHALGLHETDASPEGGLEAVPQARADADRPSLRRGVILDDGRVVGVVEAGVQPTSLTELVRQAEQVRAPKGDAGRVLARRVMPGFAEREPYEAQSLAARPAAKPAPAPLPAAPPRRSRGIRRGGGKGAGRGSGAAGAASPATGADRAGASRPSAEGRAPKVTCHFLAEMEDEVVVGETTSVDVTLAREVIDAVKAVRATGRADVQVDRKLIVELIPKKNFVVVGDARVEADLPEPGNPAPYIFDVKPTDAGEGEILVRIRQGAQPLANLLLRPRIVSVRTRPPVRRPQEATVIETAPGPQPRHELSIFELERGGQRLYQYILRSPELGVLGNWESKVFKGSREDFIKGVYEDIEDRYLGHKDDYDEFQRELRDVGAGLWDELFPEELQAALWKHREQIDNIMVLAEEPFIPWELVHLKPPQKGLPAETRFFGQMGLVRWLHNVGWPTTQLRARDGRCRYVIPHYAHPDYELPEAEAESGFLERRFKATPVDPHAGPVRRLLETEGGFDLLHFACHGVADSADINRAELLLEGRVEGAKYVTEKLRASVIEQLSGLVGADGVHPMVTLNACQAGRAGYKMTSIGGFSRAFLRQGAGMFVAALWSVGDHPARHFTETLYDRLLKRDTLAQASTAAREAAREAQEATWLAYTVYGNPHAKLSR